MVGIEKENIHAMQDLKLATGMDIVLKKVESNLVKLKIDKYYGENRNSDEDYAKKLFNNILEKAVYDRASDVHIEPFNDYIIIRNRVDGELREVFRLMIELYPALATVIKLKAHMDITEKRLPQDGRVDLKVKNNLVDIRVSTIPTIYKEKIVLRILNRNSFLKSKEELGFSKNAINIINKIINKKSGILLVIGPTGSGKTTTVYSILNELQSKSKNIMTIENPVEYKMEGVNQIQVNSKIGLTFEEGLRAILRQDPDIIMIGEIRDIETAKIAVRAAITGHLVISTMHTNDSVSSIARLIDMQIPPYLISASLIGVISQKLVRKLCNNCSHDITISDDNGKNIETKVAIGCNKCKDGYIGRTSIYEILEINDDIKLSISQMKDAQNIKTTAIKNGMITFDDTYKRLVKEKIITLEEYLCSNYIDI
ncbi:GspE/PulE family protein [Romboutsia sp. Marseille-P6047]|uniref:GspE/PulE family protein n=1 Tax=Romboutsia sp. Marseille-P6047 TaxID=2161817 RepID=UPI001FAAFF52|nr:GspE/PulE family protein [Romboutsia sp. Marseille-P6047]